MILRRHAALALLALATAVACADSAEDEETEDEQAAAAALALSNEDYAKRQQQFADSIIRSAATPEQLVDKLGKGYAVADIGLTDTVKTRLTGSDCFEKGREIDPYLGGSVSFMLHMSIVGVDAAYVQDSKWSSPAGNVVNACLNAQAKGWKIGRSGPLNTAYIVRHDFPARPPKLQPDPLSGGVDSTGGKGKRSS